MHAGGKDLIGTSDRDTGVGLRSGPDGLNCSPVSIFDTRPYKSTSLLESSFLSAGLKLAVQGQKVEQA